MTTLARDIFLWGPMGAGKSTLGAALAAQTGVEHVDTDWLVEQRTGQSVATLFAEGGEPAFRRAEADALDGLLAADGSGPRIVSLGGGALLDRDRRLRVLERGTLVVLSASPEVCAARANVSRETRPLLRGLSPTSATATLRRLFEDRASAYAEAHLTLDTSVPDADQLVAVLLPLLARHHTVVAAGHRSYAVRLGSATDDLRGVLPYPGATQTFLVTDENVGALQAFARLCTTHGAAGGHEPQILAAGERHKTLAGLQPIWDALLAGGADRSAVLVGVGGGVVTDMTGFAASVWHRGIRWVAAPTTLLGMVDASVGGKTGVDLGPAKNALGAFHPPIAVHASLAWLETEPERSYRSGLVELLKTALLARPDVYADMLRDPSSFARRDGERLLSAVSAATSAKAAIVSRDPEERGERAVLNLGHTLGHALEAAGGYERHTHGEAVGLGLLAAIRVGTALGVTDDGKELETRTTALLETLGLPTRVPADELSAALPLLGLDKKRKGREVRFVALEHPGRPRLIDLPIEDLRKLLVGQANP